MAFIRLLPVLLVLAAPVFAQKTNDMIRELQRDIATLQQDMKGLNSKFDEKVAIMNTLLQQALDEAKGANKGVAVVDRQLKDSLKDVQNLVAAPVAGLGSKIEQLSTDFAAVSESVKDVTSRTNKVQAQLTDMKTMLDILIQRSSPAPAQQSTGGGPEPPKAGGPPAGVTQQQVYEQAFSDKDKGQFDQAFNEFQDYLKWFPTGEYSSNSQFYIADIYYLKKDYDSAVQAFDLLLEKYPDSNKVPDAMFMKGRALMSSDRRNAAIKTFDELIKTYPNTEAGRKARELRKQLVPQQTKKGARKG